MELARWPRRSTAPHGLVVICLLAMSTPSLAVSPGDWGASSIKSLTSRSASYPTIISNHACVERSDNQRIYCFGGVDKVATNASFSDSSSSGMGAFGSTP